ncbi:hypothetical protein [Geosporobacter ferrireducens]|uniref:Uncharacterized protein n=1 Tax=Geosporobacter ferrireducens TaxID=1424294 RepID=A0A1D8GMQ3_9FIRM|nr:hypothetical protein [Geosporobacter ferrireducens]AOT72203.1 hypothetical protein Gferi_23260 [Geosporobacter ferrireducens]MTI56095.1 hypothetical protein [Geosporobacter ferrireducens]
MDYQKIYLQAYQYMGEKVLEEDCGKLCNSHCCRNKTEIGEKIGIYLMPHEFESVYQGTELEQRLKVEKHSSKVYYIPPGVKFLYYFHCDKEQGCFRELRPIQCRSYPFEPHLEKGILSMVIEKEQIHQCPLLDRIHDLRDAFVKGVFMGWETLLQIPEVRLLVEYDSKERARCNNILHRFNADKSL